jgi:hypothetical protein
VFSDVERLIPPSFGFLATASVATSFLQETNSKHVRAKSAIVFFIIFEF